MSYIDYETEWDNYHNGAGNEEPTDEQEVAEQLADLDPLTDDLPRLPASVAGLDDVQKQQVLHLLAGEHVERQLKTRVLLNLNRIPATGFEHVRATLAAFHDAK